MTARPFDLVADPRGTVFRVRVSPGASRARVIGEHAGAVKISVSAPPEKGKANSAVVKLLAKVMGVDRKSLVIISGQASRDKRLLLAGKDIEETGHLLGRAVGL